MSCVVRRVLWIIMCSINEDSHDDRFIPKGTVPMPDFWYAALILKTITHNGLDTS